MVYHGEAGCVLPDGAVLPVTVRLASEPGLLDGLRGMASGSGLAHLNLAELKLRLPDGRERVFLVTNAIGTSGLELVSNGDWL